MGPKRKILVVDDEESIRYTFESFLADEGYDVSLAADYDEAVEKVGAETFDLIFADVFIGRKTGIDFLRQVKDRGFGSLVVMITGVPDVESAAQAVRFGAFDYIPKPVRYDTLIHIAKMALNHKTLLDEKERYRSNIEAIFRSVKDAIVTVDKDLTIMEVNQAAGIICGIVREDIGTSFPSRPLGCGSACLEVLAGTIEKKCPLEAGRIECRKKDRPDLVVTVSTAPLIDKQGGFSGAIMVVRDESRLAGLERDLADRRRHHNITGKSSTMQEIYTLIDQLADLQTTVLITGESGTGKELIADALHYSGKRSAGPLVKVNCAALSENLLESELFGHVKGAFTDAFRDKTGRFQRADGGTIFLDEIGEISQRIQLRLLRVLQDMEFERVGDSTPVKVNVRVIAATNRDLAEKIKRGEFREDLYYRLKVVEIAVPPLRKRRGDIPLLVDHFIAKFGDAMLKKIDAASTDVMDVFMRYPWPGNVRELEHAIEHAVILCSQNTITVAHLPRELRDLTADVSESGRSEKNSEPVRILEALEKTGGNKAKAARLLAMDRKTLYRKMWKYGLLSEDSQ